MTLQELNTSSGCQSAKNKTPVSSRGGGCFGERKGVMESWSYEADAEGQL